MAHARNSIMPQADYEALEKTLHWAARTMSREQIIDLADSLFDWSRARREPRSWRSSSSRALHQPPTD